MIQPCVHLPEIKLRSRFSCSPDLSSFALRNKGCLSLDGPSASHIRTRRNCYSAEEERRPAYQKLQPQVVAPFNILKAEARALGIPSRALPELPPDPSIKEVRSAVKMLEAIMASFLSANL